MQWRDRAACKDSFDPRFFPDITTNASQGYQELIEEYCARCPVSDSCLRYALDLVHAEGTAAIGSTVWGGLTPARVTIAAVLETTYPDLDIIDLRDLATHLPVAVHQYSPAIQRDHFQRKVAAHLGAP